MRFSFFYLCLMALAFLTASGCTRRPEPPQTPSGTAVGKAGDTIITDKDLTERIAAIEKSFPRIYSSHVQKKNLLQEMMHIELLYRAALRLGLDKRYEFKSRLADLYVQQLSEEARSKISEDAVQDYYQKNKYQYDQISARHILMRADNTTPKARRQEIKSKLEQWRTELLKDPSKFAEYARQYSEDSSRANGGELGFFSFPMMVRPFSEAAFKLPKVGDISPVVETQFGYHLIQLSGDQRGFEPHKNQIRDHILRATQRERLESELARLKKAGVFEIYEDNLAKLSALPVEIEKNPEEFVPKETDEPGIKKN